jgi:hypothetical protein
MEFNNKKKYVKCRTIYKFWLFFFLYLSFSYKQRYYYSELIVGQLIIL